MVVGNLDEGGAKKVAFVFVYSFIVKYSRLSASCSSHLSAQRSRGCVSEIKYSRLSGNKPLTTGVSVFLTFS